MANVGDLIVHIKGDSSSLDQSLDRSRDRMKQMGATFRSVGRKMMLGVTAPILGIAGSAIHTAAQFEKSMNKVSALSGATGKDLDALRAQSRELGRTTVFAATEAAEAQGFLAMAGFKTNEILGAMPAVLNLAAAGQLEIGRTADIASNIMSGYGMTTEELGHATDVLAKAMTSANVDMEMLGTSFTYAGALAATTGVEFEDLTAMMAIMGNAGIQGSKAGTQLAEAIRSMISPTEEALPLMKKMGLSFHDAEGNLKPFVDIMEQLEREGASASSMIDIFGARAGSGMAAVLMQGSEALRDMRDELRNAGGTAKEVADVQMKGLAGEMKEFTSAMESAKIEMGNELLPILTELLNDHLTPLIQKFSELDEETKKFIVFGMIIAAAVAPLMMVIGMMMPLLAFLLANPIGLLLLGIAVAIGLIVWALMDWEGMQRTINGLWEKFGEIVSENFSQEVWDNFSQIVEGVVGGMVSLIQGVWAVLRGDQEESKKKFKEMWGHFGSAALGVFDSIWEGLKFLFERIGIIIFGKEKWEEIKDTLRPIFGWIRTAFEETVGSFVDFWKGVWTLIKGIFSGDMSLMQDGFKQMGNGIIRHLNWLIDQVNKILPEKWEVGKLDLFETEAMKKDKEIEAVGAKLNEARAAKINETLGGTKWRGRGGEVQSISQEPIAAFSTGWRGRGGEVQSIQNVTVNMVGDAYGMDDFDAKVAQAVNEGVQRGGFQGVIE